MSDIWYYSDGAESQGPLKFQDLVSVLSRVTGAMDVLVWSPGFPEWKRAGEVKEISDRLLKPPPLPPRKSAKPTAEPAATPDVPLDEFKWVGTRDPRLKGIKGWLVLLAIGQALGPLKMMGNIAKYYSEMDASLWKQFPLALAGEATINTGVFLFVIYTSVAFFKTSRTFPRLFVWEVIVTVFAVPVNAVWVAMTIAMVSRESFADVLARTMEGPELAVGIVGGLIGVIWIVYLRKSRRAANTFVN